MNEGLTIGVQLLIFCRAAYSGTALAFRDRLIIEWNRTQQRQTFTDQKRVYCMSYKPKEYFHPVSNT